MEDNKYLTEAINAMINEFKSTGELGWVRMTFNEIEDDKQFRTIVEFMVEYSSQLGYQLIVDPDEVEEVFYISCQPLM